jgi:type 1 fimbria pilin
MKIKANTEATMEITKLSDGTFAVDSGEITESGTKISARCQLNGTTLQTVYSKSMIVLTPIRVKLGPVSLAAVSALKVGESYKAVR